MLRGSEIILRDNDGVVVFSNKVADRITIKSSGTVNITLEQLEKICSEMRRRLKK